MLVSTVIDQLKEGLTHKPAYVSIRIARDALKHLQRIYQVEQELRRLQDIEERYERMVGSYNRIWSSSREVGIQVFQTMDEDVWTWEYNGFTGTADTPEEALLNALVEV